MSWLNLNQSLSTLKGQISNFATEVLSEGIIEDDDPFAQLNTAKTQIKELEMNCAKQEFEIKFLRKRAIEIEQQHKINSAQTSTNDAGQSVDDSTQEDESSWFWDPPEESAAANYKLFSSKTDEASNLNVQNPEETKSIEELKDRLARALQKIESLSRCLMEMDGTNFENIKELKRLTRENYDSLSEEHEKLKGELESAKKGLFYKDQEMESKEEANAKLKENLNIWHTKFDKLEIVHRLLIENTEKFQDENQYMTEENLKLSSELNEMILKYDNLEKSNKELSDALKRAQEENQELIEENFKLQEDYTNLQNDVDEMKNKDKHVTIEEYRNLEEKFSKLEMQYSKNNNANILKVEPSSLQDSQIIIEQLKCEIAELQNKLNTNEEIKRLNVENVNLRKEIESLKNTKNEHLSCEVIKNIFQEHISFDIAEIDKKLQKSCSPEDVLKYTNQCISHLLSYKSRNETLEIRVSEDSKEINKLSTKIDEINAEMNVLIRDLTHCEHECSEMKKNNDFLIAEISALKSSSKLEPILEQHEDNVLLLQSELEDCSNHNKTIEAELEGYQNEISSIKTERDELKKQIEELNIKFEEGNKSGNRDEIDKLKTQIASLASENEKHKIDISIIDNEMVLQLKQISELKAESLSIVNHQVKTIQDEKALLENELFNVISKLETIKAENEKLKLKIISLEDRCKNVDKSNLPEQFSSLTDDLNNDSIDIAQLKLLKKEIDEYKCINSIIDKAMDVFKERGIYFDSPDSNPLLTHLSKYLELIDGKFESYDSQLADKESTIEELRLKNLKLQELLKTIEGVKEHLEMKFSEHIQNTKEDQVKIAEYELFKQEMEKLNSEKNELINLVKQKHGENINYHNEIQRLNEVLMNEYEKYKKLEEINLILCQGQTEQSECKNCEEFKLQLIALGSKCNEIESTMNALNSSSYSKEAFESLNEKNQFLMEKCEVLTQSLLQEQNNLKHILSDKVQISEREQSVSKEIERLRRHLLEIEEAHTQELIVAEQKCQELQAGLSVAEDKAKHSSTVYTSNSIRANQEVETLRNQLRLIEKQRDDIQAQLYQSEDRNNKHAAALTNLQCVLEQYQMGKNQDNEELAARIKRELDQSQAENQRLVLEISNLQDKLMESNNGLKAAARLSSQLDTRAAQLNDMKHVVAKAEEELSQWKMKYKNAVSNQHDKVDKTLMKNLVIGLVQTWMNQKGNDKLQALRILTTVLDFDEKECERVGLGSSSGRHESLVEEFVKFVEKETKPQLNTVLPNLLNLGQGGTAQDGKPRSRRTSEIGSPTSIQPIQRNDSPLSHISNDSSSSANTRMSPNMKQEYSPAPIPIVINPNLWSNDPNIPSGNAILDVAASSNHDTGVNQTRNTQGAILKNVLLDM